MSERPRPVVQGWATWLGRCIRCNSARAGWAEKYDVTAERWTLVCLNPNCRHTRPWMHPTREAP